MRTLFFLLIISIVSFQGNAQIVSGSVKYQMILIDTIQDDITPQDSFFLNYTFLDNNFKWESGIYNHEKMCIIMNKTNYYSLNENQFEKQAYLTVKDSLVNLDSLINYVDTSIQVVKTTITKIVAGVDCKKAVLQFKNSSGISSDLIIWYSETVSCNSIIPGIGLLGNNAKGLILEYEIPNETGKIIITAQNVSFDAVSYNVFVPNLEGYTIINSNADNNQEAK